MDSQSKPASVILPGVNVKEEAASSETVPAIQYRRTLCMDENGKYSPTFTEYRIHDVFSVVEGTLADALTLLPYHLKDLVTLLVPGAILRKTEHVVTQLQERPKMVAGSIVVSHEDALYGLVIKDSEAGVVGPVRQIISSLNKAKRENCLLIKSDLSGAYSGKLVNITEVEFDPQRHVLIVIPLGGYCFVPAHDEDHESGDEDLGPSTMGQLTLLLGTSFLLFEDTALNWNKFKDSSLKELAPYDMKPGQVLYMYSGGCVFEDGGFAIHGLGSRMGNFNEASIHALMYLGTKITAKSE